MTDTIHEITRDAVITGKRALQNSAAAPSEKATGINPAQVTRVPVNIGLAVSLKAAHAASVRDLPASSWTLIISTAMIASSTNKPRAMIKAPNETLCKSMPAISMMQNTPVSTRGIQKATTIPVRKPKLRKLTIRTIIIASLKVPTKSLIESLTTAG